MVRPRTTNDLGSQVTVAFDPDGPLAALLPGYQPRHPQQQMAAAIAQAITSGDVLICEAGTGVGKTLAYLVPAILSRRKIAISTGTRNLQEQVFYRDLGLVRKALGVGVRAALLKGRANYLCRHRLELTRVSQMSQTSGSGPGQPYLRELHAISVWAESTGSGDIAEVAEVPEGSPVWRHVTSTAENCLGQRCPRYDDCHVVAARQRAAKSDILVVNHHLFFADLALREEGFGELLPGVDAIILDEAHQLPDLASQFFGMSLSSAQIAELVRDTRAACQAQAPDASEMVAVLLQVERTIGQFHVAVGAGPGRISWSDLEGREPVLEAAESVAGALVSLSDALDPHAQRGEDVAACHRRSISIQERLELLRTGEDGYVRWLEVRDRDRGRGFTWHASPLEAGTQFSAHVASRGCSWVLTSATLSVGGSLASYAERVGLPEATTQLLKSPFDYARQALCYLPPELPAPRSPRYCAALCAVIEPVIAASMGRTFVLFTSHDALAEAASILAPRLSFPLVVQGDAPRSELIRRFLSAPDSVLLGTGSFWEGVDVRGDALSCVIIDKLPFAPPDDPVLRARMRHLEANGGRPFVDLQLPQAVIALKQGVGRLIRDQYDTGVVVLCDPRIVTRGYGRVFVDSLPPMGITRDLDEVRSFFRRRETRM